MIVFMKKIRWPLNVVVLMASLTVLASPLMAADSDPAACLAEIQTVCAHLEDKLEACLADRGDQLSPACRDQLKATMSMMQDPSGPAACVPDVQRLCPHLEPPLLGKCISDNQNNFSEACRAYLQSAGQKTSGSK